MEKKNEDYLHLYYHCLGQLQMPNNIIKFYERNVGSLIQDFIPEVHKNIKPILRPLTDMTEHEKEGLNGLEANGHRSDLRLNAKITLYLISLEFDLFDLIESGLAIDKTKLNK